MSLPLMPTFKKILQGFPAYSLLALLLFAGSVCRAEDSSDLIVHFETNGRNLSPLDQGRLKEIFKETELNAETKILVVGYTDNIGGATANYALSRSRANSVKNYLTTQLKLDASKIIAVGRGAEYPVAPNDTAKNRSLNRRAEIFILGNPGALLTVLQTPGIPETKHFQFFKTDLDLLKRAQRLVKIGAYDEALLLLKKAEAAGGDQYALWYLLHGIIGYFQGVDTETLIAYFKKSLQLDENDIDTIDFLSRAQARKRFESGLVTPNTGLSGATAIKVDTIFQEYEFMKLFKVEPLSHTRLADKPIDMWQCRTPDKFIVEYYFDISSAYQWAFKK